jgi:hypothetical protein
MVFGGEGGTAKNARIAKPDLQGSAARATPATAGTCAQAVLGADALRAAMRAQIG